MKQWFIALVFLAIAGSAMAQAPYTGGAGDGYDRIRLNLSPPGPGAGEVSIGLFEDGLQWGIQLQFAPIQESVRVQAFNVTGQRLWEWSETSPGLVSYERRLSIASQVLLLQIELDGGQVSRKIWIPGRNE